MVDTKDSKSFEGNFVRVQVPLPVKDKELKINSLSFFYSEQLSIKLLNDFLYKIASCT